LNAHEERSVAIIFTEQFNQLNEESPDVSNLLKVLSFLDPENIPTEMIVNGAREWLRSQDELQPVPSSSKPTLFQKIKKWTQPGRKKAHMKFLPDGVRKASRVSLEFRSLVTLILSPVQFPKAIQKLQNLSLVEHRSDTETSSLWMHDLIQFMMQESARKEKAHREWFQSSVSLICAAFLSIENPELPQSWIECEEFVPHLRSLNERWNSLYGASLALIKANAAIAKYLKKRGRYSEAEVLSKEVLKSYETEFGCEHPGTFMSINNLALVYKSQGRYGDAEELHKKALAGREKYLGADHLDTLQSVNNLALVYESLGRYDDAEALHKRALAARRKHLGADHTSTLKSINNLATVYKSQGRYDDAEALHRQALAGREKYLGANHPDTLRSVNNLALVYESLGRYDDAEALHERALAARKKYLGADHPDTLQSINNLATVYQSQGRDDDAEALYKQALAGCEKHLGTDHPRTRTIAENLANLHHSQGVKPKPLQ
jgi:tetratricopeptide (TPR) repeat protein